MTKGGASGTLGIGHSEIGFGKLSPISAGRGQVYAPPIVDVGTKISYFGSAPDREGVKL